MGIGTGWGLEDNKSEGGEGITKGKIRGKKGRKGERKGGRVGEAIPLLSSYHLVNTCLGKNRKYLAFILLWFSQCSR